MTWDFEAADAGAARFSRRAFVSALRAVCTSTSDITGAELVFTELVANVVRHAPGPIAITVQTQDDGAVTLSITDTGPPFALTPSLPPAAELLDCGRGLYIVAHICPRLSLTRTKDGNCVAAVLPVQAAQNLQRRSATLEL